jgi:hypothetical protein
MHVVADRTQTEMHACTNGRNFFRHHAPGVRDERRKLGAKASGGRVPAVAYLG